MSNELQQSGELQSGNGLHKGWLSLPEVFRLAECLVRADDFIPAHFKKNVNMVAAAIMTGQELGLAPMASLRGLYVVRGKVGVSYDAMGGLLRKHGYRIEWPVTNAEEAQLTLTHKDGTFIKLTYAKEDAVRAGLWGKDTWKAHPASMLRARALSNAARAFSGEVLSGIYCIDEVKEIEEREEKVVEVRVDSKSGNEKLLTALNIKNEQPKEVKVLHEDKKQGVKEELEDGVQEVNVLDEDGELTDSFVTLSDMMDEAKDTGSLMSVAEQIKDSNISEKEKEMLRAKFSERKGQITKG